MVNHNNGVMIFIELFITISVVQYWYDFQIRVLFDCPALHNWNFLIMNETADV